MRILHLIGSISRQGGGPSRSSQGLVAGLRAAGVDAWLMTLNHGEEPWIKGCEQFINGGSFEEALEKVKPDIVHLHGIWQTGLHRSAVVCRRRKIPYVIAPRGMLEPWSLKAKWLKKRIARFLYQDRDLKKAAALHATAESEAEQFRSLGFRNPVIVSPNGVNLPEGALGVGDRCRCTAKGRRAMAEKKVAEWLAGVDEATFEAALAKLVEEKTAAGEYRFGKPEERELALAGARRFFREFAQKIIELSDGRCVYFAPDPRSRARNLDNAVSWAEYAFHAVSSGGDRIPGKNYNYRHYSEYKIVNTDLIEPTLLAERCVPVKRKNKPNQDAVKFFGTAHLGGLFDVVVRLDEYGNANANMTEVTFEVSTKHGQKKLPQFVSLTEAIRTVVSHQTATGTYPPNESSIAFSTDENKGDRDEVGRGERGEHVEGNIQTFSNSDISHRALFVSRMHPKKGVLELVESWARVFGDEVEGGRLKVGWRWVCELVYTLNGEEEWGYEQRVKQRILDLGMSYQDKDGTIHSPTSTSNFNPLQSNNQTIKQSNISSPDFIFTGPLDDEAKWEAYARADLFVLPTYSENFGIVVAEALWAGVPVITTKGTPWQDLIGYKCGWWIDLPPKESLDKALIEVCGTEGLRALPEMGQNGHRLVEEKYTWRAVVKAMVHGYEQVLNTCEMAPCERMFKTTLTEGVEKV